MIISNTQKQWKMRIDGFFYRTACAHTTNRPANIQTASLSCTHCRKNNVWHWAPAPQGHRPRSILPGVSLWCIYLHVSSLMHASQKVTRCVFLKWKELHFFSYLKVLDSLGWMESLFWNCKAWQSLTIWLPFAHHCLIMQQISLGTSSSMHWDVCSAIEKIWYKKYINTMPRENYLMSWKP